jgi:hypothetical protein
MKLFARKIRAPRADDVAQRAKLLSNILVREIICPPNDVLAKMRESNPDWAGIKEVFDTESSETLGQIKSAGLWKIATKREQAMLERSTADLSDQERLNNSWLGEALHPLLWALGYEERIFSYDEQPSAEEMVKVGLHLDPRLAKLRHEDEIENQRVIAELWHWRSRTRWLQEQKDDFDKSLPPGFTIPQVVTMTAEKMVQRGAFSAPIDGDFPILGMAYGDLTDQEWSFVSSITVERHKALNWLAGYAPKNDWDATPTDT